MKISNFKKTGLATSISLLLSAGLVNPVYAQEADAAEAETATNENRETEVILVKGIRGSLMRSMDLKRSTSGVMDAISAEEMGKFPDTNLAESLQRITGVTVSRANGEGSQITVRGFGPDFNMVTLNGRQMPSTGFTRSFNFDNLSSEGVSALETYKTARADLPTGGLGATVNIVTSKPFQSPGERFSVMGKAINDTSNVEGDDITPEFAAIYSNTFFDDRFGFSFTISHHQRDFQKQLANIQGWQYDVDLPSGLEDGAVIDNRAMDGDGNALPIFMAPDADGVLQPTAAYFFPKDMNYGIENIQRERTNGQVTFQFAATDDLIATLDYTFTDVTTGVNRVGWGIWNNFGGNINGYELDANGTAIWADIAGDDGSFTASRETGEVESKSIGLNIEWIISDTLELNFDYHDSSSETDNGGDEALGSAAQVILGSNRLVNKIYDYRTGDIPGFLVNWENGTNELTAGEIDSNFSQFIHSPGKSEIQQLQIDGEWLPEFDFPLSTVKFGVAQTDQSLTGVNAWSGLRGGPGFSPSFTAIFPDSMFTRQDATGLLDQFEGGGTAISPGYFYTFDIAEAIIRQTAFLTEDVVGTNVYVPDAYFTPATTSTVEEETLSIYLNTVWEFDIGDYPVEVIAGVRYEETDVISPSQSRIAQQVNWVAPSEWITTFASGGEFEEVTNEGGYDVVLPMIDFKLDITDDLVGRVSWGKSITRAPLGDLLGGLSLSGSPKIGARTGSRGNTNLKPFESTNIDLSLEYYYDEGSYASVGLFWKDVEDWIETSSVEVTFDGLYDVYKGPRYNDAVAQIEARGDQATDVAIFEQMIANGFGNADGAISPDPSTDPLIVWRLSSPENVEERSTNGVELAVQHLFGDSGYGAAVNATFVDGDVEYDPYILTTQAALPGLSDSANLQLFYEKDGLSVKVTYAWRDEYLIGQGQGQGTSDVPPQFAKEYGQWDMSINYDVDENLTVFFDAVNINDETEQHFGRFQEQFLFAGQYGPRYSLGVRYSMD